MQEVIKITKEKLHNKFGEKRTWKRLINNKKFFNYN